jgi:CHAT domain-containing protein
LVGHGLADDDLVGLVLSLYDADGRPVDGLVRGYEIYGLELDAELVVLSACRTGIGQEVRGEGLIGLSRSFLYAGASRVLASLWDIDDRATADLMERFYVALFQEHQAPARALQTAQLALQRSSRWSAPHYWAGFVLQGDAH